MVNNTSDIFLSKTRKQRPNKLCCNHNSRARNRASGAHHSNTHGGTPNKHVNQNWCEMNGKYLIKWLNTWIMIYLGAQNDPETGPLRPIFITSLNLVHWHVHQDWCKTNGKCLTNDQIPELLLILGPRVAQNWAFEAHILNTFISSWNVKQYWQTICEHYIDSDQTP